MMTMTPQHQPAPMPSGRWFAVWHMLLRMVLVVGIIASFFVLLAKDKGVVQNHLLKQDLNIAHEAIREQQGENQQLQRILTSLRQDTDMIEFIARHELMLIGEDEVLFDLPPHPDK